MSNGKQDPSTVIHLKIDEGSIFKALSSFWGDILALETYLIFDRDFLKMSHRTKDENSDFFIDVFVKIKRWNLTEYQYVSKKKNYILGLETKKLEILLKSCNKSNYFILQREGTPSGGIRTTKSPKEFKYCQELTTFDYRPTREYKYKTPIQEPVCVITGSEFCDMCSLFKDTTPRSSDTVEITIFKSGFIFSSSTKDKNGKIQQGQIKYLGFIPDDTSQRLASCMTSKTNLTKLINLKKICPNSNIRIYSERDEKKKLKPLKLIYNVGNFGKIIIYVKVEEK